MFHGRLLNCGTRIVDSFYKFGDIFYFLDIGWPEASSHPDHCIMELIEYDPPIQKWMFEDKDDNFLLLQSMMMI
jgi:hypothetical protein